MKRRTMRKICIVLLVSVLLIQILCLASCGNNKHNDNEPNNDPTGENTTLSGENEQPDNIKEENDEYVLVRFITDQGVPISIVTCKKGESLVPPTPPRRIGHVFTGWSGDYNKVAHDVDIIANYSDISSNQNVISADTVYTTGTSEFDILIGIFGNVDFCGLDMDVSYDSELLELIEVADVDDCVILNDSTKGIINMNYVTTSNTTGEVAFMTLKFKLKADNKAETSLQMQVKSIYVLGDDDSLIHVEYQLFPNRIIIEEVHNET